MSYSERVEREERTKIAGILFQVLSKIQVGQDWEQEFRKKLLESANEIDPDLRQVTENVMTFRSSLHRESDRGCALAAAAYLEERLGCLIAGFVIDCPDVVERLLESNGPASTFSARIDLAYLLGLIGPKGRRDLHLIRRIRNDFAHVATVVSFLESPVRERCTELYQEADGGELPARSKYVRVTMGLLGAIDGARLKAIHLLPRNDVGVYGQVSEDLADILRGLPGVE